MLILGIETSCDETAVSLLTVTKGAKPEIHCEEISSQVDLHALYGGVVPELASREHLKNLPVMYQAVFSKTGKSLSDVDGIAVTKGPGLKGCLLMGLGFAKALSLSSGKPFIGVNHIEGHILSPFLTSEITFPYIALVVSGGHTELFHVRDVGQYEVLARTTDDAAGEAFDKSANLLGLPYPGGALLAKAADETGKTSFSLPKVMREAEGFSFSGLKTAIHQLIKKQSSEGVVPESVKGEICFAVQEAIVDALVFKLKKALSLTKVKHVAIVGGVAANRRLRDAISRLPGISVFVPGALHCTDNASMIAYAGAMRLIAGQKSELSEGAVPRWAAEEI